MDLRDRTVVVAGGTGVVGECAVAALLDRGASVAVPSRSAQRAASLTRTHASPQLHTFAGGMDSLASASRVRDEIMEELGPIDAVVAALGGWWEGGTLAELAEETWRFIMDRNLNSHFFAARAFLPVLIDHRGAVYLTLNGVAGGKAVSNSGPISVAGAAQRMMIKVLASELEGRSVRLHELSLMTPVVTHRWEPGRAVNSKWLTGEQVGQRIAAVLTGEAGTDLLLSFGGPG